MKKIYLAALTLMGISPLTATAQEKVDMFNPEKNSVTSQSIAPDARAGGMGDVGVATDPDVASQFWNPAKYPLQYHALVCRSTTHHGCASLLATSTLPTLWATTALATIRLCRVRCATSHLVRCSTAIHPILR